MSHFEMPVAGAGSDRYTVHLQLRQSSGCFCFALLAGVSSSTIAREKGQSFIEPGPQAWLPTQVPANPARFLLTQDGLGRRATRPQSAGRVDSHCSVSNQRGSPNLP
ncbi:hypothetical protein LX32DRAFT_372261 [Colletotrichum zoysiae]|uniref:Uncharacterized protein n=1 Tax=Colletotrichum zoysiae TaxID=1216348 RepID=A0AAD9HSV4_9PEZI|nr:hypothetical protein LX32DRAFT_372261 [Colletotrichum zoysiae]